jgi:hypothetical protein
VGKAYAVLSDADQRRAYDHELMLERRMRRGPEQLRKTSPSAKLENPSPHRGQRKQGGQQEQQESQRTKPARLPTRERAIPKPSIEDADPHALARKRLHEVHSVADLLELTEASDDGRINVRQASPRRAAMSRGRHSPACAQGHSTAVAEWRWPSPGDGPCQLWNGSVGRSAAPDPHPQNA